MPALLLTFACVVAIALWLFRGVPLATTPRGGPLQELWIAFCISAFPMIFVGGVAYTQPAIVGEGQLKFLLVSSPVAVTGSAIAICFFAALGFRLAFARTSPFAPEQYEGKRIYRCHLGGFQLLYPKAWRIKREGPLTYVFAAKQTQGVLRMSRVYHDSSMGRDFEALLAHADLNPSALALDQAQQKTGEPPVCHLGSRPFETNLDRGYWTVPPQALVRRVWALDRELVLFLFDYVHPEGLEGPELEAELRALDELIEFLWVSQRVVVAPG